MLPCLAAAFETSIERHQTMIVVSARHNATTVDSAGARITSAEALSAVDVAPRTLSVPVTRPPHLATDSTISRDASTRPHTHAERVDRVSGLCCSDTLWVPGLGTSRDDGVCIHAVCAACACATRMYVCAEARAAQALRMRVRCGAASLAGARRVSRRIHTRESTHEGPRHTAAQKHPPSLSPASGCSATCLSSSSSPPRRFVAPSTRRRRRRRPAQRWSFLPSSSWPRPRAPSSSA